MVVWKVLVRFLCDFSHSSLRGYGSAVLILSEDVTGHRVPLEGVLLCKKVSSLRGYGSADETISSFGISK